MRAVLVLFHHVSIVATLFALFLQFQFCSSVTYPGGIPVPGRSVPSTRVFELYINSCVPSNKKLIAVDQINQILDNYDAENLANKLYSSLYGAVGDINITMLNGKWFTVIDSPRRGVFERCAVAYFELIEKGFHTATFTVKQYVITANGVTLRVGYGRKSGVEPGETLINTGSDNDPCPYSIIRTGPINANAQYEYLVLSQPLKTPTIVLAREPLRFEKLYKTEVKKFLTDNLFWKPSVAFGAELFFVNTTSCILSNQYYLNI